MGIRVSIVDGSREPDDLMEPDCGHGSGSGGGSGDSRRCLVPFNYAGSIPPPGCQLASFPALPPGRRHVRGGSSGSGGGGPRPVLWSIDVHFAPRSERDLIACFAGHYARPGMTPEPINSHLSAGQVCQWRIRSRQDIVCSVVRGIQSTMTYPCQIAPHASRPLICYSGDCGLATCDLDTGQTRNGGKFCLGEVVKSVAVSPDGRLLLALIRLAHRFHLRIVRYSPVFAVDDEVQLSKLIPCLRLSRTYTETGHCAWSPDGTRVGFASSTGHYGVLLRRCRRPGHRHRRRRQQSLSNCGDDSGIGGGLMRLEFARRPSSGGGDESGDPDCATLSTPRAFAFWPVDKGEKEEGEGDDTGGSGFRCVFAVGGTGGCVDVVGDVGNDDDDDGDCNGDGVEDSADASGTYRRLERMPLDADEDGVGVGVDGDSAEVLRFCGSGRLLAVGCRSGRVLVWGCRCCARRREFSLHRLMSLGGSGADGTGPVTSVAFADSESVLASGDASGRIRLWRLFDDDIGNDDDDDCPDGGGCGQPRRGAATVGSLGALCLRAVATACPASRAGLLPLPRRLLAGVCVNSDDRRRALTASSGGAAVAAASPFGEFRGSFTVSFF